MCGGDRSTRGSACMVNRRISKTALRTQLRNVAPAALSGRGGYRGFRIVKGARIGLALRGLTKALDERVFSTGSLPWLGSQRGGGARRPVAWRGPQGGRRRGVAIDKQLGAIANGRLSETSTLYRLTRIALAALRREGLVLVRGQQCVASTTLRIGTAADLVAFRESDRALVLVELKCGFDGDRRAPAKRAGRVCKLRAPLSDCVDCALNRHVAQLAATHRLFVDDTTAMRALRELGIDHVEATLLYVKDDEAELVDLSKAWMKRAHRLVQALRA